MSFRDRPIAVWAVPLVVLLFVLAVLGSDAANVASGLRGLLFDAYQRAAPRPYENPHATSGFSVRVLDPDPISLARLGAWPWPHAVLARLTGKLKDQGAAVVVFDLPLDKPDPASPRNLLAQVPPGPAFDPARAALQQMPSPDDALAAQLRGLKAVTGLTLGSDATAQPPRLKGTVLFLGNRDPISEVPALASASGAVAPIEAASTAIGARSLMPDQDGRVRRMPLVFRIGATPVPSLDAETMRVAAGQPSITVRSDDGEGALPGRPAGIASVVSPAGEIPTAPDGSFWIAFSGPNEARKISAAALDEHTLPAGVLKNAIVYVGAPDETVLTPDGPRTAAEVHAEAMENILLGAALRRPPTAVLGELVCLAIFGLATVLLFARLGVLWAALATVLGVGAAGAVSWHLYTANHVLFDALGPSLGLVLVFIAGASSRAYRVASARAQLRYAFAGSLSPDAIDKVARKPQLLKMEGESRTVTYLSCGIRNFSALAASFRDDPASFTRLIQRVLEPLMAAALSHGGTIDRLTSDGFTAFWNAPLDDPEHAIHACEAASRMTEAMANVNDIIGHERRIDGVPLSPVEIGIGIATGSAIAGGFRTHGRSAYSVNGDCSIVANRVQALSAQYGPAVIVSESTRKSSERGFAFLEVDYIACGAQDEPLKLYAMLGNPVVRASPKFRALMTFHDHIFQSLRTQQWEKTRELIDQCRKLSGASQKLYDLHLARVGYFEANPPGKDWDGAFRPILK